MKLTATDEARVNELSEKARAGDLTEGNLAWACPHCNLYKGVNIAGFDSASDELVP